jgi:hypothetical protein
VQAPGGTHSPVGSWVYEKLQKGVYVTNMTRPVQPTVEAVFSKSVLLPVPMEMSRRNQYTENNNNRNGKMSRNQKKKKKKKRNNRVLSIGRKKKSL